MQLSLKDGMAISNPTHYCIRHGDKDDGGCRLCHFRLEASHDGHTWTTLDERHSEAKDYKDRYGNTCNNSTLLPNAAFSTASFAIGGGAGAPKSGLAVVGGVQRRGWRHLRLLQTGKNSFGTDSLCCAGFEIYATLARE